MAAPAGRAREGDGSDALQLALDLVCEYTRWPLGHVLLPDPKSGCLVSAGTWHVDDPERYGAFIKATEGLAFEAGTGLPGRILAGAQPTWITDVRTDENFPRVAAAVECGIGAGIGFPVLSSRGVEGVMEFFAAEPRAPEPRVIELISQIGVHVGALFDRTRTQASLEASEDRFRSLVEQAPDAWFVLDRQGEVMIVNAEAERLSGYGRAELVGMRVESLVPERLRGELAVDRAQYMASPTRRGMGARGELMLLRPDGSELPVDISLSPIELDGEVVVVCAVRDISERRAADEALRASEARLAEAERLALIGSWTWNVGDNAVAWSEGLYRTYGVDPDAGPVTFGDYIGSVHPDHRDQVAAAVQRTLATGEPYEHDYRIVLPNKEIRWVHAKGEVASTLDEQPDKLTGFCQDITRTKAADERRRRAQADLSSHQRLLERIARGQPMAETLKALCLEIEARFPDARCSVLLCDRTAAVLRHAASPSLPEAFTRAIDGLPIADGAGACGTAAAAGEVVVVEDTLVDPRTESFRDLAVAHDLRSVWSQPLFSATGDLLGTFAIYRHTPHGPGRSEIRTLTIAGNVAALAIERNHAEEALSAAAMLDPLTGLPNRSHLLNELTKQLSEPRATVAVLFLDFDRFKWVNDSLGHPAGDRILVDAAARLQDVMHKRCGLDPAAVLARFGGDEFSILVSDATPHGVTALAQDIRAAFTAPFILDGGEFFLTMSVGVACNDHPADAFGLVRDADAAMYAAKDRGGGRHAIFDEGMRDRAIGRVTLEAELRRGIDRGEFLIYYQPILDLRSGAWSGAEALVRWQHPERGLTAPDDFIPLAEETGLIVPLGLRILELVVAQAAAWSRGEEGVRLAVNTSIVQLADPGFAAELERLLAGYHVDPSRLVVEVTESAAMEELDAVRAALEKTVELGVDVFVDDFGTGYSSIARLGDLPVRGIKIDKRFTSLLGIDPKAGKVLAAIGDLAHALDLRVVAEGIETHVALAKVTEVGCDYGQGFHIGEPVTPTELQGLIG